jgi:hypothetical protein
VKICYVTVVPNVGIKSISGEVPNRFILYQNYPNPFNPATKIRFGIPSASYQGMLVQIVIYDVIGSEIKILLNENLKPGTYEVDFDGSDLPSGIYFYILKTSRFMETKKMLLVK